MADDEEDFFAPPDEPVEVFCLHCGNVYCSDEIRFVARADGPSLRNGVHGDWMCPAPGCDGVGYHFDIHNVEEWEGDRGDDDSFVDDDESFIDDDESFFIEDEFDDELASDEACPFDTFETPFDTPDFLSTPAKDPDAELRDILRDINWWDAHDYPFVRVWNMRLDFTEQRWRHLAEDPQQTYKPFNEDDIPF